MNNAQGDQVVALRKLGGLFTDSGGSTIPEGASPMTWDTDFLVAQVKMRPTLKGAFSFSDESSGPKGPTAASDQSLGLTPWQNPENILAPDSSYATCTLNASVTVGPQIAGTGANASGTPSNPWTNPGNVTSSVSYATCLIPASGSSWPLQASAFYSSSPAPAGAVLTGISISFKGDNPAPGTDNFYAQLISSGSAIGYTKLLKLSSTPTSYTLGSSTDLWGVSSFPSLQYIGVQFIAYNTGSSGATAEVNDVQITFYFSYPQSSDLLIAEGFGFSLPSQPMSGFIVGVKGYRLSTGTLSVQLLQDGIPVGVAKTISLPLLSEALVSVGSATDMWGTTLSNSDVNNGEFGVAISWSTTVTGFTPEAYIDYVQITAYQVSGTQNFLWVKTYVQQDGTVLTLALDNEGVLWQENVTNAPGVLNSVYTGIRPGSYAKGTTQDGVEYICFGNQVSGFDEPRQWNGPGQYLDRVSQVGPGAPPSVSFTSTTYTISSITQVAQQTLGNGTASYYVLWSSGPTLRTAGNVLTFYGPIGGTWVGAGPTGILQPGDQVVITGVQTMNGYNPNSGAGSNPAAYIVTSVGTAQGSGGTHPIFTVTVSEVGFYDNETASGAKYQPTLSTLTTSVPVPNLQIGGQITITGTGTSGYDNTWTILQTPNSSQLQINNTSLTGNVATYSYTLISGSAPSTGQLVTIFGTTNGNGIFNITNGIITGTGAGTFTVSIVSPNISSAAEEGNGYVSGTIFQFDPGQIFTNSTGGTVVGTGNLGAGIRQCVVMFQTRNGFITAPSPYLQFNLTEGANSIVVTNLPIGPPNVTARIVAFTGASGSQFYFIPEPVTVIQSSQTYNYTSTVVNDNVSTQATFTFTDAVLLAAEEIDVMGNNLFDQGELGASVGNISYASRMAYFGTQFKVLNLNNWSFDGGIGKVIPPPGDTSTVTQTYPLGWTVDATYGAGGSVIVSPHFGNSYYIKNSTGSEQLTYGMIEQGAYQDQYNVAIIQPSTLYSVRVQASCPSGGTTGNLVIDLYSPSLGKIFGKYQLPFSSLTTAITCFYGTMLTTVMSIIPDDLILRVYATGIGNGDDLLVDRFEVFPTLQPNYTTQEIWSYVENFEAFDMVTGILDTAVINQQPNRAAFNLYDVHYIVKDRCIVSTRDTSGLEPAQWSIRTVSNSVGTKSSNGVDYTELQNGEAYVVVAGKPGVYVFNGGEPLPIHREIQQLWSLVNWDAEESIWVRNDIVNQRIYVGVPLPTPNQWLPNAPSNPTPTTPNVILMCSYRELNSSGELAGKPGVHDSAFTGHLLSLDIVRKWSIWQIASPYADFIERSDGTTPLCLGNSSSTGKLYILNEGGTDDDGSPVNELYTTYGFVDPQTAQVVGLSPVRMTYKYLILRAAGNGSLNVTAIPNVVGSPYSDTLLPLPLSDPLNDDLECPLNETGWRLYLQFSTNSVGQYFSLSGVSVAMSNDPWTPVAGGTY